MIGAVVFFTALSIFGEKSFKKTRKFAAYEKCQSNWTYKWIDDDVIENWVKSSRAEAAAASSDTNKVGYRKATPQH